MSLRRVEKNMMASLVLAIIVSVSLPSTVSAQAPSPNVVTDLVIQVQELQDEVRTLRGQLEEQQRELENLKSRQRDQYLDLDQRISELRSGAPVSSGSTAAPSAAAAAASLNNSGSNAAEEVPEVRPPMDVPSETVAIDRPQVESQSAPVSSEAEKAAYDKAFQALKELRYADAAEEFQAFLNQYPNSEYSDNAQYWLGESYYVTRNYDIALTAFQRLMDRYPDSPKVPDALLKVGYTYYELKQWDNARVALTRVQESYPDTTLARLAESRLRSMRMEGHY